MPASVLLERLALAAADAGCIPTQRSRRRSPEPAARRTSPVGAHAYGAAALAVSVIGGAAAATASFGTGALTDLGGLAAADLSVALPQAAAPEAPAQAGAAKADTGQITQILPAAVGAAAPAGADQPKAQASTIAASILDQVAKVPAAVPAAVPAPAAAAPAAVASVVAAAVPQAPAKADPAPAQAISLGSPAAKAMSTAMSKIGKPYVWGAAGPNAFDCSGLVQWAYKQWGISLPHSSAAQSRIGTPVAKSDLRPGDLVFFYSPVSHVGIYVGNGNVLNASEPGEPVKLSKLANMPFHNARRL